MNGSFWRRGFARWKEQRRQMSIRSSEVQWDNDEVWVIVNFKDGRAEREWSKTWVEIRKVVAFKQDQYTYDRIYICLLDGSDSWHSVDEEMMGWDEFMAALPANLPGCLPWESMKRYVALPPFRENATVLFER